MWNTRRTGCLCRSFSMKRYTLEHGFCAINSRGVCYTVLICCWKLVEVVLGGKRFVACFRPRSPCDAVLISPVVHDNTPGLKSSSSFFRLCAVLDLLHHWILRLAVTTVGAKQSKSSRHESLGGQVAQREKFPKPQNPLGKISDRPLSNWRSDLYHPQHSGSENLIISKSSNNSNLHLNYAFTHLGFFNWKWSFQSRASSSALYAEIGVGLIFYSVVGDNPEIDFRGVGITALLVNSFLISI